MQLLCTTRNSWQTFANQACCLSYYVCKLGMIDFLILREIRIGSSLVLEFHMRATGSCTGSSSCSSVAPRWAARAQRASRAFVCELQTRSECRAYMDFLKNEKSYKPHLNTTSVDGMLWWKFNFMTLQVWYLAPVNCITVESLRLSACVLGSWNVAQVHRARQWREYCCSYGVRLYDIKYQLYYMCSYLTFHTRAFVFEMHLPFGDPLVPAAPTTTTPTTTPQNF